MSSERFLTFVRSFTRLLDAGPDEPTILVDGRALLADLVAVDDWLPAAFAEPHPQYYRQYLLWADPLDRLSVVSFVWGPGQKTPLHDHLTWGLVGGLRGREKETVWAPRPGGGFEPAGTAFLEPGQTTAVSPTIGDVHEVANALDDRPSISIHVYGANIGRVNRHVFDPESGAAKPFVSGYANDLVPNPWNWPK